MEPDKQLGYSDPNDIAALLATESRPLNIGELLSDGWKLFMRRPELSVGYTVLILLVHWLLNQIPALGQLASALLVGPLMGGFYLAFRKLLQEKPVQFGDYLAGFNDPVQLILVGLVGNLLIAIGLFLLLLPGIYLAVSYLFSVLLVADRKMEFWQALEGSRRFISRQWFAYFVLALLIVIANMVGAMLFGVGLLLSIPFSVAVVTVAYDRMIGLRAA
jgi:hypothetical protein